MPCMSASALDRLLALLVAAQLVTGLITLRAGAPSTAPLFWLHGVLGGTLLVAVALKLRRSVRSAVRARRWRALLGAAVLTLLAAAALVGGLVWVASGRLLSIGPWTVLTLHVWAALAIVPVLAVHLIPRRWRLLRPPRSTGRGISRRTLLASGALAVAGVAVWAAANVMDGIQGGVRRFTGSRWLPDAGIPPATTFYGEAIPPVDPDRWRLRVTGAVAQPLDLDVASLRALGEVEVSAVLDCTSGWAIRTDWRGIPLRVLLDAAGARVATHVKVTSTTGWTVPLEGDDLADALLATHVAGQPLPAANGAPCRLVVPRRRGLDWVKWVTEVRVA